ncbi:MAG: hypothetical protein RI931_791 [Actinomycetota bacterium]
MLLKITNQARDYAWGSKTLISDYFGIPATGRPMAEIWFGTHDASPAQLPEGVTLTHKIGRQLPFLMKILAADSPLSIQAHPNSLQAKEGFERENSLGISLTSVNRNYKDDRHKPELIVALSDFEALAGFKPLAEIQQLFTDLAEHQGVSEGFRTMSSNWLGLLAEADGLKKLFAAISGSRSNLDGYNAELASLADGEARFALAERLNLLYPGDSGVVLSLLLNHIYLEPGEALFLAAGSPHAYIQGLGIEVMASSDNVLRGGLTPKHVDLVELEKVVVFEPAALVPIRPREISKGLFHYECAAEDFIVYRAELSGSVVMADLNLPGESIVLCTAGEVAISNSIDEREVLRRGEAAYIAADSSKFTLVGSGTVFIATA